ncbi:4-hydroxybenzoate polyprenyltransferase [Malassezia psittaci]|uniref:4-hydroxybenzoate polyprenyltransferase n=1 Tax=Malassezia psittaci TaxID=1821823 RepID=A0AAF0JG66_9BASI|nr:4-hydroxybenzoate polyprenyltransferase [Malassezia psittaci]
MSTFPISRCLRSLRAPYTVNGTIPTRRYANQIETGHDISRFFTTSSALKKGEIPATPPPEQHPKPFSLKPYMELARVDRPIGSWLLYMPCTWSITLASQFTGAPVSAWLTNLALFGAGSFIMRSAGCTINDMWDAKIDAQVGACYWPAVLPLYASTTVWGIAYDTIYAHQDKIDDAKTGVGSTAQVFGDHYTKPALVVFSAVWMALLAYAVHNASPLFPWLTDADMGKLTWQQYIDLTLATGHPFFCMAWLVTAAHIAWQIRTVNLNNPRDCFKKFASNRTVGLIIFTGLAADYLYQQKYAPYKHQHSALRAAPHA